MENSENLHESANQKFPTTKLGCLVIRIQDMVFTRQVTKTESPSQVLVAAASHTDAGLRYQPSV